MKRSFPKTVGLIIGVSLLVALGILLSPLIAVAWLGHIAVSMWLAIRLRGSWPANKFVLLGYSQSPVWAPFIEQSLVPQLGEVVVLIDRSKETWKREHPIEARALSFWGGMRSYNPIAVVIRRPWRVRVFRFYKAFQQFKHGKPRELDTLVSDLLASVKEEGRASA
jgi:hypothetical protein